MSSGGYGGGQGRGYGQPPQGYGGGHYGGDMGRSAYLRGGPQYGMNPGLEGGGGMRNVPFTPQTGGGGDQFSDPRYANPVNGGGGVSFTPGERPGMPAIGGGNSFTPGERTGMPSLAPQGRNAFAGSMLYGGGQPGGGGVSFTPPERTGMPAFQQPQGMNKPGVGPSPAPGAPPFAGDPYAPGYQPGGGWDIMQREYAQQRQNQMGQQAPFGRYADGTPMADPSINFRANANRGRYGGGWGT